MEVRELSIRFLDGKQVDRRGVELSSFWVFLCMALVDIPLHRFVYRFRPLSYLEEFGIAPSGDERATRLSVLALALAEVSGLKIPSPADARRILETLSDTVRDRIWLLYKAGSPEDRLFRTRGLFQAPEPNTFAGRAIVEEAERESVADQALAEMERKFGKEEVREAQQVESKLFEDARARGLLQPLKVKGAP